MRSRLSLIAIAVILSLLATMAAALYLNRARTRIEKEGELANVLIASRPIPAGTPLNAIENQKLAQIKQVPRRYLAEDAIDSFDKVKGRVLAVSLSRGEQFTAGKFQATEQASLNLRIPAGLVAISIPVDEVVGVADKITAGDRVSVIGTFAAKSGGSGTTKLFLQNIEVLSVSYADSGSAAKKTRLTQGSGLTKKTVTLAVAPADSEKLVLVEEEGHVWLVLLPPTAQAVATPGQTQESVFK